MTDNPELASSEIEWFGIHYREAGFAVEARNFDEALELTTDFWDGVLEVSRRKDKEIERIEQLSLTFQFMLEKNDISNYDAMSGLKVPKMLYITQSQKPKKDEPPVSKKRRDPAQGTLSFLI